MNADGAAPLKILVLTTTFPVVPGDGTPEFVLTLCRQLAREGAQVTVVAPHVRGAKTREAIDGVNVRRFRYFPARWQDLADDAIVPTLRRSPSRWLQVGPLAAGLWWTGRVESRRVHADVVHAHWIIPGGLIARLLGLPFVITAHGSDVNALRGRTATLAKRFAVAGARFSVPVSKQLGDRIRQWGVEPEDPIPMGVDTVSIGAAVAEGSPSTESVLYVGRLVEVKGVDALVRSLEHVPGASLRIVGDGPLRADLRDLAQRIGVAHRVIFLGRLSKCAVLREMGDAAVLAIPSRIGPKGDEEGVPVVLAEAMAASVPVVACDSGGIGEHLVDGVTGWLVPPGDVDALGHALSEALANPVVARERSQAAKIHAAQVLDIKVVGRRYYELLSKAASDDTR